MGRFFKRDPEQKAKRHVEKALLELEDGYPDYASTEYEKAARLFLEAERVDFAVKYFREASQCAVDHNDHTRAAEMKIVAAEALVADSRFDAAGGLYSEASDHLFRVKKLKDSTRTLSVSVLGHLAALNFDTAINMMRKAEKRLSSSPKVKSPMFDLAQLSVSILCEGSEETAQDVKRIVSAAKAKNVEAPLVDLVANSIAIARQTKVVLEWAGPTQDEVNEKIPLDFELRYNCPVPVNVIEHRYSHSSSLKLTKEPEISSRMSKEDSWLIVITPVLSGDGSIGPFVLTLAGEGVLMNKHSNILEFRIAAAPSKLVLGLVPERTSCNLGEEALLDVSIRNEGDGPADNITLDVELTPGLELSLGSETKTIQFLGPGESILIQLYVRGVMMGDEVATLKVSDMRSKEELQKQSRIRVG